MTAQEMKTMVTEMNKHGGHITTRFYLDDMVSLLSYGFAAIGRDKLADELRKMYNQMEDIDTSELVELDVFHGDED